MKTIKEWFSELPESHRDKAIANLNNPVTNQRPEAPAWEAEFIGDALIMAFRWAESPEGFDYWDALYESLPHT